MLVIARVPPTGSCPAGWSHRGAVQCVMYRVIREQTTSGEAVTTAAPTARIIARVFGYLTSLPVSVIDGEGHKWTAAQFEASFLADVSPTDGVLSEARLAMRAWLGPPPL